MERVMQQTTSQGPAPGSMRGLTAAAAPAVTGPVPAFEAAGGRPQQMTMRGAAASPLRAFLRTEAASAVVLVAAVAIAMAWANAFASGYGAFWALDFAARLGPLSADLSLRTWVNSGAMTLFFLVAGLEARREFDLGDLRDRRKLILPAAAGLAGMAVPVLIYLAVNHGGTAAHGWGSAMSTDTALALGVLAVAGRGLPDRIRTFVLTVLIVDDIAALVVIAAVYSGRVRPLGLTVAAVAYAGVLAAARLPRGRRGPAVSVLAVTTWGGLLASGVDPVVAGLAVGMALSAYTPRRGDLEEATTLVRLFRERPTAELATSAARGLAGAVSANERLRHALHRVTGFVIVPLFALANAGIVITPQALARAVTSPVAVGIFAAYVAGKPLAVTTATWLVSRASRGTVRPPVGWAGVAGSGALSGIGLTVSLLVASLAFRGTELQEAKLGVLAAAVASAVLSLAFYRLVALLPAPARSRALLGTGQQRTDLSAPADPARDHARGPAAAPVTVVEYGDFECPSTQMAAPTAGELLAANGDIRYIWRHLPLRDVHPGAQLAAEAAEAAAAQGRFWPMHDLLLANQQHLRLDDVVRYAGRLGLDVAKFRGDLLCHVHAARVARDIESADRSGVAGTPTFFINGRRHDGPQDLPVLSRAIDEARALSRPARARPAAPPYDSRGGAPREVTAASAAVSPALGPVPAIYVPLGADAGRRVSPLLPRRRASRGRAGRGSRRTARGGRPGEQPG
jgi:Na+/H+ antiporter NhaA